MSQMWTRTPNLRLGKDLIMSRSAYIYVIESDGILAAFTVKYEAQEWLLENYTKTALGQIFVSRCRAADNIVTYLGNAGRFVEGYDG